MKALLACCCVGLLVTVYGSWEFIVGAYEPNRPCTQVEEIQQKQSAEQMTRQMEGSPFAKREKPIDVPWCYPQNNKVFTTEERIQGLRAKPSTYIPMFLLLAAFVTVVAYAAWSLLVDGILIGLRWTVEARKRRRVERV